MFSISTSNAILGVNNSTAKMNELTLQLQTNKRINSAKDDSSGLSIANQLRSQHLGLAQAIRNANDGISITNIADSALEEYTDVLSTIRDKVSAAISDSNDTNSRTALGNDISALVASAEAIAKDTSFNGINLLDGTFTNKIFQTGAYSGQTTSISIANADTTALGINALDVTDATNAATALDSVDAALKSLDSIRSSIGSTTNGLESKVRNMNNTIVNIKAAESNIRDVDAAAVKAELDEWTIKNQASVFAFQMAQSTQQNILRLFQ